MFSFRGAESFAEVVKKTKSAAKGLPDAKETVNCSIIILSDFLGDLFWRLSIFFSLRRNKNGKKNCTYWNNC